MAKFSRFDPRNKKNGRNKKISLGDYPKGPKRSGDVMSDDDRYLRKYKKIQTEDYDTVYQDEVEDLMGYVLTDDE